MPFTVNGIGTTVCRSRGDVGWGSSDAMECLVVFFMPIVPYRAMHTFDWSGEQYRHIPSRWSWDLTLRTFARPWSWGAIALAAILALIGFLEINKARSPGVPLVLAGLLLAAAGAGGLALLHLTERRNKAIRRVIGGITIGTCDPANLTGKLLEQMAGNPQAVYGTATFADAVEKLLAKGSFAQAMWAARLAVAVEDEREGERLTDVVLADPEVQEAIEEVRRDPNSWAKVMLSTEERETPGDRVEEVERIDEKDERKMRPRRRPRDDEDY
jgi:hypothetical protein